MLKATVDVKTRKPVKEVQEMMLSLPAALSGRAADPRSLRKRFLGCFLARLLGHIVAAYLIKSQGGSDDLGQSWKPLAESTIRRKQAKRSRREPQTTDFLSSTQKGLWTRFYKESYAAFRGGGTKGAELVAAARRAAWVRLEHSRVGGGTVPIMIDTGRLLASLQPGQMEGSNYVPPNKDQSVRITPNGINFVLKPKYAKYAHKKRRIYPGMRKMRPWVLRSMGEATMDTLESIKRALE